MRTLQTMAQIKRKELQKALESLITIRSSAYVWNNIPQESLEAIEKAVEYAALALAEYDKVVNRF